MFKYIFFSYFFINTCLLTKVTIEIKKHEEDKSIVTRKSQSRAKAKTLNRGAKTDTVTTIPRLKKKDVSVKMVNTRSKRR